MRRLLCILLPVLLLVSCSTTGQEADITRLLSAKETAEATYESTRQAYEEYPDDSRVLYNWAYLQLARGQWEGALSVTDEALASSPQSLRFWYLKAAVLREMGRHQSYLAALDSILEFDPGNTEVLNAAADYHVRHFHPSLAASYARRVLDYSSADSQALSVLALTDSFYRSLHDPVIISDEAENRWRREIILQEADIMNVQRTLQRLLTPPVPLLQSMPYPALGSPWTGQHLRLQDADPSALARTLESLT